MKLLHFKLYCTRGKLLQLKLYKGEAVTIETLQGWSCYILNFTSVKQLLYTLNSVRVKLLHFNLQQGGSCYCTFYTPQAWSCYILNSQKGEAVAF